MADKFTRLIAVIHAFGRDSYGNRTAKIDLLSASGNARLFSSKRRRQIGYGGINVFACQTAETDGPEGGNPDGWFVRNTIVHTDDYCVVELESPASA